MSKNSYLYPLEKSENQKLKIAVVDIETHEWTKVVAIGFYDGEKFRLFNSIEIFFDYLTSSHRYRNYKIFAHNGGKFDFLPFIDIAAKRKYKFSVVQLASRIAQVKITFPNCSFTFRDSICLLQSSLKKLTEAFGVEHGKLEFDHKTTKFDINNPEHIEYLRHDCMGLYEILKKFFSLPLIKDVEPKLTLSSTAISIHRTMMKNAVRLTSQRVQNFTRTAYVGGRCEIFKTEAKDLTCSDLNSLYPFCMKNYPIPLEHKYSTRNVDDFGFHDVTIEVPDIHIPVLPGKFTHNKQVKLLFPTGNFRGVFFSEEIKLAVEQGARIRKYHSGEAFTKSTDFFAEYVDTFYKMRQLNKGTAIDLAAKLLMNGLYGKYGQRETTESLKQDNGELKGIKFASREVYEKYKLIKVTEKNRSPSMLVHIAASVTAWGRIHLYRTGLLASGAAYCDTDSVFGATMPYSNELGAWKKEFKADYSFFRLPKLYFCVTENGNIIKAKGFPPDIRKTWNIEEFKKSNLYNELERPMGFKASLLKNQIAFSKNIFKKSIISGYTKRVILPDGINTRPWNIKNNQLQ